MGTVTTLFTFCDGNPPVTDAYPLQTSNNADLYQLYFVASQAIGEHTLEFWVILYALCLSYNMTVMLSWFMLQILNTCNA